MSSRRRSRKELMAALNVALRNVSGQSVLHSQALAERARVNSTDLECLDLILLKGPVTAGALAEATGLTTGAITGVIDRLERAGYAARERDGEDRRKVMVRALPAVEKELVPLTKPMERAAAAMLAQYSDEELAFILEFLTRAHAASVTAMTELREMPGNENTKVGSRKSKT
jgi:DNA-binding MarR family transcriptional regulator